MDTTRASALIDTERQVLAERPGGVSRLAEWHLLARKSEVIWLAGDAPAAARLTLPDDAQLMASAVLRDVDLLHISLVRALVMADRASQALRLMESLVSAAHDGPVATLGWLRTSQALAEAQLATGRYAAASQTAAETLLKLEQAQGTRGSAYRDALATAALAAVRAANGATASTLLARIAQQPMPAFASAAERADCELRRAQALRESGQGAAGAVIAAGLLADLASQHPLSPRLALARQLAAPGG